MSDNYEFMKASIPQDIDDYSPYIDKQYNNYINDINNGVYTNNSLTLVNFDLGQIYNSQKFTDTSDLFAVIPITMVAAYSNAGTLVAPTPGSHALLSIKSNYLNLIHQADLQVNGKTLEPTQPFINVARHFQLLSEMSVNDLKTFGHTIGFSDTLDNTKSMIYYGTSGANGSSGNGLTNNRPFIATAGTGGGSDQQIAVQAKQNSSVTNGALQYKVGKYLDTCGNGINNIVPAIVTAANLANEFRPYYTTSGNYMIWYDYAIIKLNHVFESLTKMGLVRRFDATLRLWVNTGTVNATVGGISSANINYSLTPANNTFSNTCPLMIHYLGNDVTNATPALTTNIVAGLYIAKPPATSFSGANFASAAVSHPLQNCRIYYSQITVQPQKSIKYIEENRNKKVVYRTFVSNLYTNIGSGNNFNNLINSGIVHPTGVLIVPFLASSSAFGDSQWKSPFDTCPATTSPCSLTNLQVTLGGQNVLQSTLFYTFENFIEQVNLAEQLTSADFGVSTGLINQGYWEWSRFYYVNVERSPVADKLQPRNINISFINNSAVAIDVMVFIFYSDEFVVDVETGIINK